MFDGTGNLGNRPQQGLKSRGRKPSITSVNPKQDKKKGNPKGSTNKSGKKYLLKTFGAKSGGRVLDNYLVFLIGKRGEGRLVKSCNAIQKREAKGRRPKAKKMSRGKAKMVIQPFDKLDWHECAVHTYPSG